METYQSLTEDIPDERTRFKVALKTSKTSADHILAALDQLLNVMKDAKEKFARGHEARAQEKLGASQQLIQSINEQLASKREQIAALNVEMDALNEQVITATREQSEERDHLIQVQSGFEAAHAQVIGRLNDQKNRVSSLTTKV